jgi:hypothetical protein
MLFFTALFSCCDEPEISLLCKEDSLDKEFNEVYLIKNNPANEDELREFLNFFNQDLKEHNKFGKRTFLKEHDNFLSSYTLGEPIDYEKSKCEEIDNMDIICIVSKIKFHTGGDTIIIRYFE